MRLVMKNKEKVILIRYLFNSINFFLIMSSATVQPTKSLSSLEVETEKKSTNFNDEIKQLQNEQKLLLQENKRLKNRKHDLDLELEKNSVPLIFEINGKKVTKIHDEKVLSEFKKGFEKGKALGKEFANAKIKASEEPLKKIDVKDRIIYNLREENTSLTEELDELKSQFLNLLETLSDEE